MRVVVYILFVLAVGLGMMLFGVARIAQQQRALASFNPTHGTVTQSEVRRDRLGKYRPVVTYTYVVAQRLYEGDRLAPLAGGGSHAWAKELADRFKIHQPVTVYVDPTNPANSYLLPFARFYPYGLVLLGMAVLGVALLPLSAGGFFESGPQPHPAGMFSWYGLAESSSPLGRALRPLAITVVWLVVGGLVGAHYFLVIGPPYEWLSASVLVYLAAGLVPLGVGWKRWWSAAHFGECKAWSTTPDAHLDMPVVVKFEQKLPTRAAVREARVGLVCMKHGGLGSQRLFTTSADEPPRMDAHLLFGEHKFEVPPKKRRASTPFSRWHYPRVDWYVQLDAKLESGHTCRRRFPITARNGGNGHG